MSANDDLEKRMKEYYEQIPKTKLIRKTPVVIRIDGKSHHTFTKGFEKPFDKVYMEAMQNTMKYLCENIQGCVFGYTQSDEITLILIDYQKLNSSAWFDYEVQKMCSVAASMATMAFNKYFNDSVIDYTYTADVKSEELFRRYEQLLSIYHNAVEKGVMFDARCFSIPKEEVINCLIWRQQDATRNSILSVAQSVFSHKEMQGINCKDLQNKLLTEKNINWNDYSIPEKRGTCCIKKTFTLQPKSKWDFYPEHPIIKRDKWVIDKEMPILKDDRDYVEKHIFVGEL